MKTKQSFVTNSSSTSFIIAKKKAGGSSKITITLEFQVNDKNLMDDDYLSHLSERPRHKDLVEQINAISEIGGSVHIITVDRDSCSLLPLDKFNTEETIFLEEMD